MDLREKVARHLCASDGNSGFCSCVGGDLGCRVGRGELFTGDNCKAVRVQLLLSGYMDAAEAILAIPEIAEALELMDEESPIHLGPEEQASLAAFAECSCTPPGTDRAES